LSSSAETNNARCSWFFYDLEGANILAVESTFPQITARNRRNADSMDEYNEYVHQWCKNKLNQISGVVTHLFMLV